jgi:protein gp37
MGDLFHEKVENQWRHLIFNEINAIDRHTYIILTKRPQNALNYITKNIREHGWGPLPNHIWLGVTAENQEQADRRIPILLQIPAAVRFVSMEPMLGAMDISEYLEESGYESGGSQGWVTTDTGIDWIILGAESGPKRRPHRQTDMYDVVKQCQDTGIPVFVKQIQAWDGKLIKDMSQFPPELQVRQYPEDTA